MQVDSVVNDLTNCTIALCCLANGFLLFLFTKSGVIHELKLEDSVEVGYLIQQDFCTECYYN